MIQECRIYTPGGQLKETVSGEQIAQASWEREFGGEALVTVGKYKRQAQRGRKPGPTAYIKDTVRRIHDHLRDTGEAMTVAEIKAHFDFPQNAWAVQTWLNNAPLAQYGGLPIKRRYRSGSSGAFEYFVEGGSHDIR